MKKAIERIVKQGLQDGWCIQLDDQISIHQIPGTDYAPETIVYGSFAKERAYLETIGFIHIQSPHGFRNLMEKMLIPFAPKRISRLQRWRYWLARKTGNLRTVGAIALRHGDELPGN